MAYQRCTVHFYRNVLAKVPKSKRAGVAAMLKAVLAMESREAVEAKALEVAGWLGDEAQEGRQGREGRLRGALTYTSFSCETGGVYASTTPSSDPTARYAGARAWSAPSRTAGASSCSWQRGSSASWRGSGAPADT